MKTINQLLFNLLILSCLAVACKSQRKPFEPQPEFQAYVAHHSRLMPEAASPLRITLTFSVSDTLRQDELMTSALLVFDPPVDGRTFWADDRTIVFEPASQWPADEQFVNVSLLLSRLTNLPANFHIFRFHVRLVPPSVAAEEPHLVAGGDSSWIEGVLRLSHPLAQKLPEGLIKAKLGNKSLWVRTAPGAGGKQISYKSQAFKVEDQARILQLDWNTGALQIERSGSFRIEVPPSDVFKVVQLRALNHPEQVISIRMSQIPAADQPLSSMVQLEPEVPFSLTSDNNLLQLTLQDNHTGPLRLRLAPGLRSFNGKIMEAAYDTLLTFGEMLPAVKLLNSSTIISGSNMMLPFQTIGLRAVDVQVVKVFGNNMLRHLQSNDMDGNYDLMKVGRVVAREQLVFSTADEASLTSWQNRSIDLSRLIIQDQSSLYRVYITFRKNYAVLPCGGGAGNLVPPPGPITAQDLKQWGADYYYQPDYYYPDNFVWDEKDNPCHDSYYYYERFVSKSLFYTRLGLIAKRAQELNDFRLYVADLQSGMPVNNATVELYDYQLQRIARGKTDADGQVLLSQQMTDAWMAVAGSGLHTTYLKLEGGQSQPLGRFDVEGIKPSAGMKGFIFTERGVYRPGDTLFLGLILDNNVLPRDHPVVLELSDARNRPAGRQTTTFGSGNLLRFSVPTRPEAPTGVWTATITAGNARFSKRIRVETVVPNRMKINLSPESKRFGPSEVNPELTLSLTWLHGDPAAGQRVVAEQTVSDVPLSFSGFEAYSFTNQSIEALPQQKIQLMDGLTDESGKAKIRLQMPDAGGFRGRRAVNIEVRAYEPGGAFSVGSNRYYSDTYTHYIGIQSPQDEKFDFLEKNLTHRFNVVRVNTEGQPHGNTAVGFRLYRLNDYWWWSGDGSSRAAYVSTSNADLIESGEVLMNGGRGYLDWKPGRFDWGQYLLVVSDNGGHSASVQFGLYSSGGSEQSRRPAGASQLKLTTDKADYQVGDKAVISFEAPAGGRLLLSLENGSRQLDWRWITTTKGMNRIEINLRPEHSPNVYAHLSLLQPLGQLGNDMPLHLYGIVNLKVENPQRRLDPIIEVSNTVEAGKQFQVRVSEQKGRPMSYVLALVDEGLLDLTNFRTPDPYAHFNQREALGVNTWDMFDQVLGAYGGKLEQVMAVGGDENLPQREKARQQRFKPVVIVSGPFELDAGRSAGHNFTLGNYTGAVRVMLIAANAHATGSASRSIQVRNDLIVLATAPRLVRPNDEFLVPVTIFSGLNKAAEFTVSLAAEGNLEVVGEAKKNLKTKGKGEQTLFFRVKALGEGSGRMTAKAEGEGLKAGNEIRMSIENPFFRQYQTQQFSVLPEKSMQVQVSWPGRTSRQAWIEASTLPDIQLSQRVEQLLSYPHGCTEQIASQGMAMIYLPQLLKAGSEEMQQYERAMTSALRQLENRITAEGRIVYWPGTGYIHEWSEIYAFHLLALASRENLYGSANMLQRVVGAQEKLAQRWGDWQSGSSQYLAQAYRLYVLSIAGKPALNAMNRLRELPQLDARAARMLALAYATAGQKQAARELALGLNKRTEPSSAFNTADFSSPVRDRSLLILTQIELGEDVAALNHLQQLLSDTRNRMLSTQETAWMMLAWQHYARKYNTSGTASYEITDRKKETYTMQSGIQRHPLKPDTDKLTMTNTGQQPLVFSITTSAIPDEGFVKPKSSGLELQVQYVYLDGRQAEAGKIKQGETAEMRVRVKNTTDRRLDYLALQNILPAGWEVISSHNSTGEAMVVNNTASDFTDVRDDRVISYFGLNAGEQRTFVVRISATYAGSFVLPGVHCHAMYEPAVEAITGTSRIVVSRQTGP